MDKNGMEYQSMPANGVLKKGLEKSISKESKVKSGVNLTKITQMLTKRRQEKMGQPVIK